MGVLGFHLDFLDLILEANTRLFPKFCDCPGALSYLPVERLRGLGDDLFAKGFDLEPRQVPALLSLLLKQNGDGRTLFFERLLEVGFELSEALLVGLLRDLVQSSAKLLKPCQCFLVQGFDGRPRHGEELFSSLIGEGCLESLDIILEVTSKLLDFFAESFGRRLQESARNLLELRSRSPLRG